MKLYAFTLTPNNRKVVAMIEQYGLDVDIHQINFREQEHKSDEFLAINPMGKVPALVDGDFKLWEGNAILMYLCDCFPDLEVAPKDTQERADIERWLHWQNYHFSHAVGAFFKDDKEQAQKDIEPLLQVLEKQLDGKDYITGKLSPADFAVAAFCMGRAAAQVSWDGCPNLNAWRERMEAMKGFQATMPPPAPSSA